MPDEERLIPRLRAVLPDRAKEEERIPPLVRALAKLVLGLPKLEDDLPIRPALENELVL